MIPTSTLFEELLESGDYYVETRLSINDTPPDESYGENILMSVHTTRKVFSQDLPTVGGVIAGEISVEMMMPDNPIPRMAKIIPYIRLRDLEMTRYTEWVQKGVYYLDTRKKREDSAGFLRLQIRGYDSIMKTEQDYPDSELVWPAIDVDVVQEIADFIGVEVDQRTYDVMTNGYQVESTTGYTCREVLGYIAAMYGGNFVMSDRGKLWLVAMGDASADDEVETNYLINEENEVVTFGGDRILV
jgi:hypothetical protein